MALNFIAWPIIVILLIFISRRWLFILFALLPNPDKPDSSISYWQNFLLYVQENHGLGTKKSKSSVANAASTWPNVLLLVPIRNEAEALPGLLPALAALEYGPDRLSIVLINDGSTDASGNIIQAWAGERDNWHALQLEQNVGKAQALNLALAHFSQGEVIAIYDADERPRSQTLQHLIRPFCQAEVGGVSGRRAVSNALASPAASYTTFEGLVHQLVTMRAKNHLKLVPAILGANCAYRRAALQSVGGFKPGALLEDSDLTLRLAQAGWQVHFVPEAISYHRVPETISGYWQQHTRWARGFNDVAKDQAGNLLSDQQLPLLLRLELLIFSFGYLDRVALLGGGILMVIHRTMRRYLGAIILLNLFTPLIQIVTALKIGCESVALWRQIVWVPLFFALDIAMAVTGLWTTVRQIPQVWEERRMRP